jgi:hypothetical protein
MDDNTILQILEYTYAVVLWILEYVERNNLPLTQDETLHVLRLHLSRLEALLDEIDPSLTRNPIIESVSRKIKDPPDKLPVYLPG